MSDTTNAIVRAYSIGLQAEPMPSEIKQDEKLIETYRKGLNQLGFCMEQTGSRGNRPAMEADWMMVDQLTRAADLEITLLRDDQLAGQAKPNLAAL